MAGLAARSAGGRGTGLSDFILSYLKSLNSNRLKMTLESLNFNNTSLIAVIESTFLVELVCSVT